MRYSTVAGVAAAIILSGCGLVHHNTPVQVSSGDVNLNSAWHATLASPSDLTGAMQMAGAASMAPGADHDHTSVALTLTNATPGGVHPWELHHGQCNADAGMVGTNSAYKPIKIEKDGTGSASATLAVATPDTGSYFVAVRASTANPDLVVACGNFARPTP